MLRSILRTPWAFLGVSCFSFTLHTTTQQGPLKLIERDLFFSKYEITNGEYKDFLESLGELDPDQQADLYPDSTQWVQWFPHAFIEPMARYYHWHPAYADYPVVNITRDAAQQYCEWRTQQYHSQKRRKFKKVQFRLPTHAEWQQAAGDGSRPFPWEGSEPYELSEKDDTVAFANLKIWSAADSAYRHAFDGRSFTGAVGEYRPNDAGLFDVIGNVAEMTQDGLILGGSWFNTPEESTIESTQNFDPPHPCVGFRVVMEVLER